LASGDITLENRAQSWIYAIYQGTTLGANPVFQRHNAGNSVFTYNALAEDNLPNGSGDIGGIKAKGVYVHVVSMSVAWTVFSYFG
jgi:hypothetical protein